MEKKIQAEKLIGFLKKVFRAYDRENNKLYTSGNVLDDFLDEMGDFMDDVTWCHGYYISKEFPAEVKILAKKYIKEEELNPFDFLSMKNKVSAALSYIEEYLNRDFQIIFLANRKERVMK